MKNWMKRIVKKRKILPRGYSMPLGYIRICAVLLTALLVTGMTGIAANAAGPEEADVTAVFTNGTTVQEEEPAPDPSEEPAGSDTDTGSPAGSGTDTGSAAGSGTDTGSPTGSGTDAGSPTGSGLNAVRTSDAGGTGYLLLAIGAAAGLVILAVVVLRGKRRVAPGNTHPGKRGSTFLSLLLVGALAAGLFTTSARAEEPGGADLLENNGNEEDAGIQLLSLDGEKTLTVTQKVLEGVPEDAAFPYHLCFITDAEEEISSMDDITESSPAAGVDYVIYDADGNEVENGATDTSGAFTLLPGQSAQFTIVLQDCYGYYVMQDTPEAYPLVDVTTAGEYAGVVDRENVVVYDGMIDSAYTATVILTLYDYNDNVLAGATFALYKDSELYKEDLVTDENGQITVTDLEPGEYYFEETSVEADKGYELPGYHYSQHFTVAETLTEDATITRVMRDPATQTYNVKYAVTIYGIRQDVDEDGETLGLTFGPATGESYISTYKAHVDYDTFNDPEEEHYCIHWMSWEEIAEQCAEDPTVFEDCLENGCTHAVDLMLNSELLYKDYTGLMDDGDGAGYLFLSIYPGCLNWNTDFDNTGGWPASQVRAVFNGKDELLGAYAAYALDAENCLFSCFPSVLQGAIVPKAVKSDTVYNSQAEEDNMTTYDKLWLFSGKELYGYVDGGDNNDVIRTYEGELYQRSTILGITTANYSALVNYCEDGSNGAYWWLRSPDVAYSNNSSKYVFGVNDSGDWYHGNTKQTDMGLAPGFCLK